MADPISQPHPRPQAPHLQVYRWPITMALSIAQRVSGAALYFGTVFLAIWLVALSLGQEAFDSVNGLYFSYFGRTILFLYSLGLVHHMLGGIRYLFWDNKPHLMQKHKATKLAWLNVFASILLTIIIWLIGYSVA